MASVSPLLIISVIAVAIVALVLIVLVIQSRRTVVQTTSTTSTASCTAPPNPPGTITITNPEADILTFSWSPVSGATSYTAYIGNSAGFSEAAAIQTRITKATSISFGNLALGVTYYGKVKSTNGCGNSAFSSESPFTLNYVFPTRFILAPTNFPANHACDVHDQLFAPTDQVAVNRFCNDTGQLMFRSESDKTIRQSSRPGYCLTRDAGSPTKIYFHPCIVNTAQQWVYNTLDSTLCSLANPNTGCLLLPAGFNSNDVRNELIYGPKTDSIHDSWSINAV